MPLPSFRIILFPKPTKEGTFGVYARVTYNRRAKYAALRRYCKPDQWNADANRFRKNYPDHVKENEVMAAYERRATEILRTYEREAKRFNFDRFFSDLFNSGSGGDNTNLHAYINGIVDELQTAGNYGNSIFYKTLAVSVRSFKPQAVLGDVSPDWIVKYEQHCRVQRGMGDGGIKTNMGKLKAVCNRAIKAGLMPESWAPFKNYNMGHLTPDAVKRAIPLDDIRKIEKFETDNPLERFSADLFLFSFYARGMNLADIARLKRSNIVGGRIEYVRTKTKAKYSIPINDGMNTIMAKYAGPGVHIFPILKDHKTPKEVHNAVIMASNNVNKGIKSVARHLGIPDDIVFYTARHTYATALKRKGVSVEKISEALGHANISTTQIYLAGFEQGEIDAVDKLLE